MAGLMAWANDRGYGMVCGGPEALEAVRREIEERNKAGEFDGAFFHENLEGFAYKTAESSWARTIFVLSVPRPAHALIFHAEDGPLEAVLPPTYHAYRETSRRALDECARLLASEGYRTAPLDAPLKALAAGLGLVTYGRNNITYARGCGSYHQLVGGITDAFLAPRAEFLGRAGIAPECNDCRICLSACPTGAIGEDRFLLHAEHCLTYANEGDAPWPSWAPASAHRCLVGCLACQEVCPRNGCRPPRIEKLGIEFDEEETCWLLSEDGRGGPMEERIRAKLDEAGLPGYDPAVVGRNLRALSAERSSR